MLRVGVDLRGHFRVQYNGLDFKAFEDLVLACGDVFLYEGVFIIEVFSYTIVTLN